MLRTFVSGGDDSRSFEGGGAYSLQKNGRGGCKRNRVKRDFKRKNNRNVRVTSD